MDEIDRRGAERADGAPRYCRAGVCPANGFLEMFLASGGCVFCRAGRCTATRQTLALFATSPLRRSSGSRATLPRR